MLWGQHLRQMQLDEGIYLGLLGLDKFPTDSQRPGPGPDCRSGN